MSSEKNYLNENYKSFFEDSLSVADPELHKAISDELKRQQQHIELIASENIVSQAVLEAQGSVLTNKYAEGYPGKRYYNGCEHVDVAENCKPFSIFAIRSSLEFSLVLTSFIGLNFSKIFKMKLISTCFTKFIFYKLYCHGHK